jgi:hypothetical protein
MRIHVTTVLMTPGFPRAKNKVVLERKVSVNDGQYLWHCPLQFRVLSIENEVMLVVACKNLFSW